MPKNAVQKLQEIQKDINTVISLYEVASKTKNNNDQSETSKKQNSKQLPKISSSKYLEAIPQFDKFREDLGKPQASLLDTFKKTSSFFSRPSQGLIGREPLLGKKWKTNKPGSAPSFSSAISTAVQADYVRRELSDAGSASDRDILGKTKISDSSDWLGKNVLPTFELVMSPSKTLETAKKVLEKNNFKETQSVLNCAGRISEKSFEEETADHLLDGKNQMKLTEAPQIENLVTNSHIKCVNKSIFFVVKKSSTSDVKNWKTQDKSLGKSRSISSRERISVSQCERSPSATSKSVVNAQVNNDKDKSPVEIRPTVVVASKEDQKADQKPSTSGDPKNVKSSKQVCIKTKKSDPPIENNEPDKDENKTTEPKIIPPERKSSILKRVERSEEEIGQKKNRSNETKIVQFCEVEDLRTNQKAEKPAREHGDVETLANEFSKIIGENNEKLQKMKVSKELALEIANHFKEKYEDIQKCKGDLLQKLQTVQKNNERLSNEVQEARHSTKMLQEKIKGLEKHSMQETQDIEQLKHLTKEIEKLKTKLLETEKQYKAQLLEKNKKIEEIQIDRLEENKNGLKQQEILAKKLQRLTNEKCELLSKFEELRRQLHDSHCKTKNLEENIRQLEEEVQKQKQHLKIKTETLHETNRELEMIRLNCTDLEDQVKNLRKNIEEFDGIQHSLIRQTTEYEQQIKSNQEKIRDLQNENVRLKGELENEKDGLRIKTKIIEDQQQTIRQLKEKSEDAKTLLRKNQSLERMLNIEREEKSELQEAVQRLKWRKEELKKKVKCLENDFLLAPQEVVRDLQKTQVVLHELENQVQTKQKEWELQLHSLIREKEQACSVAEFATKKLMETTNEFQKQSEAYKGLQRLVAGNLAVKERHQLREGNKKAR